MFQQYTQIFAWLVRMFARLLFSIWGGMCITSHVMLGHLGSLIKYLDGKQWSYKTVDRKILEISLPILLTFSRINWTISSHRLWTILLFKSNICLSQMCGANKSDISRVHPTETCTSIWNMTLLYKTLDQ